MNEFTLTHTQPIRFVQDFFDYGKLDIANQIPSKTGYAGFRVLYPLNQPNQLDELGAFLGASYFRLLGKDQRYGESARGLALDCGEGDRPEEFPIFTDWWLGKPQKDDNELRLYAILDSVSCAGAYEFLIRPGDTTVGDIEAVLYLRETNTVAAVDKNRQPIKTIGLAPLTSMFWFGKDTERKFDDYRTEVHDSDGLLVHMGNGEIFWRPLDNPPATRHQVFHAPNISGFGLLQRERNFAAYQDMFNPIISAERLGGAARQLGRRRPAPRGIEHGLRRAGQHRRVLGSEKQTRAAAAVSLRLHAALGKRRRRREALGKPRRLHAHRAGRAVCRRAAVRD